MLREQWLKIKLISRIIVKKVENNVRNRTRAVHLNPLLLLFFFFFAISSSYPQPYDVEKDVIALLHRILKSLFVSRWYTISYSKLKNTVILFFNINSTRSKCSCNFYCCDIIHSPKMNLTQLPYIARVHLAGDCMAMPYGDRDDWYPCICTN